MAKKTDIEKQIEVVDGEAPQEELTTPEYEPIYRPYHESKIPVSKATGKFWQSRKKEAIAFMDKIKVRDRWDEAIRYFQNDQGGRQGKRSALSQVSQGSDHVQKYGTENIVFANVSALVPATYAKNPDIELNAHDAADEKKALMYERLVDKLFNGRVAPCVAFKNKMRRAVVTTTLTNLSYIEVGFNKKEDSSEAVMAEIDRISTELQEAKDISTIQDLEGELMALEQKVNLLGDAGPFVRIRQPGDVLKDPNSEEADLSDSQYIIINDYLRTSFIRACYGQKNEKGEWMSIYEPTHLLGGESGKDIAGHDEEINTFTLIDDNSDYEKYGYKSEDEYENAQITKVWYVWDKVTRRVLMFNDKDWTWPIWVWDDPLHLTNFFPVFPLAFYTDPIDQFGRSEVMYYLDQQDELNQINDERSRMRHWAMTKVFINTDSGIDRTTVEKFLSAQSDDNVLGVPLGESADIRKAIGTIAPPSTQFEGLFDTKSILEAVNRLSSVTPVLRAAEFRTNTTNKAIESYQSSTQTRLDEKIDAIEDCIGNVGNALLELCVQFMDADMVASLISDAVIQDAGGWQQYDDPKQFHEEFSFGIVGGSTLKPTSQAKKDMAIQLGQVLGQFAQANPAIVPLMLKIMERAFNEDVVITDEDWMMINQATQNSVQEEQGGGESSLDQAMMQIENMFNSLDEETKRAVGEAIAQGTPLKQIVQQLVAQQGQQQQAPQQGAPA